MSKRKLRLYGDADLDGEIEGWLLGHKWTNFVSCKPTDLSTPDTSTRDDGFHYRESAKQGRVLITNDDDYMDNSRFALQETSGVIVLKRGQAKTDMVVSFNKFLYWIWGPFAREYRITGTLGRMKVHLSKDGFHYKARRNDGMDVEDYYPF